MLTHFVIAGRKIDEMASVLPSPFLPAKNYEDKCDGPSQGCEPKTFVQKVLAVNSYTAYLPPFGYRDPNFTAPNSEYWATWKEKADQATPPRVIATMYRNLFAGGFLPSSENDFVLVSNGCYIPTYERLFFDLDRLYRKGDTHVLSVDLQPISPTILAALTVGEGSKPNGLPFNKEESTHQFIHVPHGEEEFSLYPYKADMIWNFRASLYYYIRGVFKNAPELLDTARELLKKYHKELNESGCLVVDGAEKAAGKSYDTEMYDTTANLILDFRDELAIDELFESYVLGQDKARVLVLKKKDTHTSISPFLSKM